MSHREAMRAWHASLPRQGLPDDRNPKTAIFVVDRGPSAARLDSELSNSGILISLPARIAWL